MSGTAALVAVGTELTADGRPDTNGDWLARALGARGIQVAMRLQVSDDAGAIERALLFAAAAAPLVVVTGGLGPTVDDVTREAVASAFSLPLAVDDRVLEDLRARYGRLGRSL